MNRKKFLKRASSGVFAAALLPILSFKKSKGVTLDKFISEHSYRVKNIKIYLTFTITKYFFENYENARKYIVLSAKDNNEISGEYDFVSKITKKRDGKDVFIIDCKFSSYKKTFKNEDIIYGFFGNRITLEIQDKKYAIITDSNGKKNYFKFLSTIVDNTDDGYYDDCFLTSACVAHKGFADDCKELTTLRNLRENIMKPDINYKNLISEYEEIAPKMLLNINRASNKGEILDSIYENLVLPSVSMVEAGDNIKAIEHYRDFVEEMKTLYL
ncbi:hypothetical protein SAMN05421847_0127 [Halpernia humi]|uniref:Uncharacterized protein n=1 Tax=Halpernia humi TaxID=493375 RepID=A0A1H5SH38_9FLAO|nr:hypothetical protein [Halpernia humi]SEF49248.1 hypothetical protein SAMN05421847_0127 [Halpernia humi]